jgi:hypothetical protein
VYNSTVSVSVFLRADPGFEEGVYMAYMSERRKTSRWYTNGQNKGAVVCGGERNDVDVIDVSTGGMRVACPHIVTPGSEIFGRLKLHPSIGPFYVQGKILRVEFSDGLWKAAVQFSRIGAHAFLEAPILSMLNA